MKFRVRAVLHNVRSSHNVGSVFRTADGAGVEKLYLTGYTPVPVDRFERKNAEIAKTALGAEKFVSWEHSGTLNKVTQALKREGFCVVAVEQGVRSVPYARHKITQDTAFIFGNEVTGLSKGILQRADAVWNIPMYGKKESLNVSVSAGIVLFHARENG